MKNKNIIIFGDSYSTFAGCIPEGYGVYYSGCRESGPDINSKDESWWGMLMNELGANLVRNDSWSGATIGYRGYNDLDASEFNSFIYRLRKLNREGFFVENKIDTVLVLGGTNDSWCGAEIGEEMREGWREEDLYRVLPAIWCYFKELRAVFPDAQIYGICNCGIHAEIIEAIKNVCRDIGATAIELHDIDKLEDHPTALGMIQIKDQVLNAMTK